MREQSEVNAKRALHRTRRRQTDHPKKVLHRVYDKVIFLIRLAGTQSKSLYVGNLDYSVRWRDLKEVSGLGDGRVPDS